MLDFKNINFQDLDPKKIGTWQLELRILIFIGIFIAGIAAGYFVLINPHIANLNKDKQTITQLKQEYKDKYVKSLSLKDYEKQLQKSDKNFELLQKQLPSSDQIANLIDSISAAANKSKSELNSIIPDKQENLDFISSHELKISLYGTYNNLGDFMNNIANLERIVNISSFDIKLPSSSVGINNNQEPVLDAQITAKSYWIVESKEQNGSTQGGAQQTPGAQNAPFM